MASCRFTESGADAVNFRTLYVVASITGVPVAASHWTEFCFPASPVVRAVADTNELVSSVTLIGPEAPEGKVRKVLGRHV